LKFKETRDFSRTLVVVTDGYVSFEVEAFELIRQNLNQANLFAFGIGPAVNRFLIEGMAHAGLGEPFIITKAAEAPAEAVRFRQYIERPVLTNIRLRFDGFDVYDLEPVSIGDVFAQRPILVYGKYKGEAKGQVTIEGLSGNKPYKQTLALNQATQTKGQGLRYLWARKRIEILNDYVNIGSDDGKIAEITKLGLDYNLLTNYTSFVAIDDLVRNKSGEYTTVQQPLGLPEGVSNYAVGSSHVMYDMAPVRRKEAKTNSAERLHKQELTVVADEEELVESIAFSEQTNIQLAVPANGMAAFVEYVRQNRRDVGQVPQKGPKGVTFIVTVDDKGQVTHIVILKSPGKVFSQELERLVRAYQWLPAVENGQTLAKSQTAELYISFE
jgi:Ca-activated chloride channel family protein